MEHEIPTVEITTAYTDIEPVTLIDRFYETKGDPEIGKELSVRLFGHAGLGDDPRTVPLVGRDGQQVTEDGKPLTLADYINFAARHHLEALEGILSFLMMHPGEPDYEAMRQVIASRLNPKSES